MKDNAFEGLSIAEREEIFIDMARTLERTAREAFVEGNRHYAAVTQNLAEAIRVNVDELARDDEGAAERVMEQASTMLSAFNAAHPFQMMSCAIH